MERVDVLLDPARAFLFQIAAFLPRLALAALVLLAGFLPEARQTVARSSQRACDKYSSFAFGSAVD